MNEELSKVPLSCDYARDLTKPFAPVKELVPILEEQFAEIRALGLEVTHIKITSPGPDDPPRFYVKFPADKQQWEVRKQLEEKLFDVGQKLGNNELTFYVTKRTKKSKGWSE